MAREEVVYASATYTLTIDLHGNNGTVPPDASLSVSSNEQDVSVLLAIPEAIPTRDDYRFIGYARTSGSSSPIVCQPGDVLSKSFIRNITNSSERTYDDGGETVHETTYYSQNQSATIHLYAQWRKATYLVTYNANKGTGAPAAQTKIYGENLTLSTTVPTREGHVFSGWGLTASASTPTYAPGDTYSSDQSITLYAIWDTAFSKLGGVTDPVEVEGTGSATWTVNVPAFSYKLTVSYTGAPSVVVDVAAGTGTANFTIPSTWYASMPDTDAVSATVVLSTYNGTTLIGSDVKNITVEVPASKLPTITASMVSYSTNATVQGWNRFVQGFSKARFTVTATPSSGARLSSIKVSFMGQSVTETITPGSNDQYSFSDTIDTEVINAFGVDNYSVIVTDSRGRSAEEISGVSVYVFPYAPPAVLGISVMRCDSDGTINNSAGDYLKVQPVYTYSRVKEDNPFDTERNSLTAQTLSYMPHGTSTPTATITCASGSYYPSPVNSWPINLADGYDVVVTLTDSLGSTVSAMVTLPPANGLWYGKGNDRLGLGKPPSGPGFYNWWKTYLKDDTFVDGDAQFNGVVDVTKRRCVASLQSPGWYRVLTYSSVYAEVRGSGFVIDMTISKDGIDSEAHKVSLFGVFGNIAFKGEDSVSATQVIDKVRYTYESLGDHGYVDIHFMGTSPRTVAVNFDVKTKPVYQADFEAGTLASVSDTPSGETIAAVYDLAATSTTTTRLTDLGDMFTITAGGSETLTLESSSRHIYITTGESYRNQCILIVNVNASGVIDAHEIGDASYISFSSSANTFTIAATTHDTTVLHMVW